MSGAHEWVCFGVVLGRRAVCTFAGAIVMLVYSGRWAVSALPEGTGDWCFCLCKALGSWARVRAIYFVSRARQIPDIMRLMVRMLMSYSGRERTGADARNVFREVVFMVNWRRFAACYVLLGVLGATLLRRRATMCIDLKALGGCAHWRG